MMDAPYQGHLRTLFGVLFFSDFCFWVRRFLSSFSLLWHLMTKDPSWGHYLLWHSGFIIKTSSATLHPPGQISWKCVTDTWFHDNGWIVNLKVKGAYPNMLQGNLLTLPIKPIRFQQWQWRWERWVVMTCANRSIYKYWWTTPHFWWNYNFPCMDRWTKSEGISWHWFSCPQVVRCSWGFCRPPLSWPTLLSKQACQRPRSSSQEILSLRSGLVAASGLSDCDKLRSELVVPTEVLATLVLGWGCLKSK